jgi:hypothetical protein
MPLLMLEKNELQRANLGRGTRICSELDLDIILGASNALLLISMQLLLRTFLQLLHQPRNALNKLLLMTSIKLLPVSELGSDLQEGF